MEAVKWSSITNGSACRSDMPPIDRRTRAPTPSSCSRAWTLLTIVRVVMLGGASVAKEVRKRASDDVIDVRSARYEARMTRIDER